MKEEENEKLKVLILVLILMLAILFTGIITGVNGETVMTAVIRMPRLTWH
ncbi:MAG: hypothetical protein ACOH15_05630 [Acetobacterium sp.]